MKFLPTVTLLAIDGAGNDPDKVKAIHYSKKKLKFGKVKLLSSSENYNNLQDIELIKIPKLSYLEWSKFVITDLHKYIDTDHYLFVDSDGFVLYPDAWNDDFLKYDYIGASFWYPAHIFTNVVDQKVKEKNLNNLNLVGNGGFTLRSKKLLLAAQECKDNRYHPEDVYFSLNNYDFFVSKGIIFAPKDLADKFSLNELHSNPKVFGFHGHKTYIKGIQC
jgi:hypothetical protein